MSTTFKDLEGRAWSIRVNVLTAKRLKEDVGVDILKALEPGSEFLERVSSDVGLLFEVICSLISRQLEERGIGADQFAESLDGETIDQATEAMIESLIAFFPKPKAEVLRRAFGKVKTAVADQQTKMIEQLTEDRIDSAVASAIGNLSSD